MKEFKKKQCITKITIKTCRVRHLVGVRGQVTDQRTTIEFYESQVLISVNH